MDSLNFSQLFNTSPNPYMVLAPDFTIAGANVAYLSVTGRTLPEIVGRPLFEAFPSNNPDSETMIRESITRAVKMRIKDELPLVRYGMVRDTPNGPVREDRFWSATHTPLFDDFGELKYVLQHTEDVTELQRLRAKSRQQASALENAVGVVQTRILKRAEAVQHRNDVLAAEAVQLRQLFSQAPGFIAVVRGPRHVYEIANAAFCRLIGHDDVIGKAMREASPEVEGQGLFEVLDRAYASGEPEVLENRSVFLIQRTTGQLEERFVDVVCQPVCDKEGMVSGIFIQGTDITDKRRAEIELTRHRDELEQLVTERTEALRKSDGDRLAMLAVLHQSQKMEALGKLTGGVAHDFNNTLQVIAGNLHLLRRTISDDDEATRRRLNGAIGGVERGAKLASHLLAFARKQPLSPVVVSSSRLLHELDDLLRRTLGETIELVMQVEAGMWNTLVDRNFLENALLNLAINARDAMQGHGCMTISAGNARPEAVKALMLGDVLAGDYIAISVSDTGCGMTREVLEKVFEPFFTTKPEGHGTGLGLSMVYGFVKQSGGHVAIDSEPGRGTTVTLYLPRSAAIEQQAQDIPADAPALGGTETILVVEDDAQVRATVVDLLTDLGYHVLKAPDAQAALTVVESGVPIDLLFTDVVMPGTLRSPELARRARALQPRIGVLFTSGYTENGIVHGGRLDEGVALLSKPYPREELARKIRSVLGNRP